MRGWDNPGQRKLTSELPSGSWFGTGYIPYVSVEVAAGSLETGQTTFWKLYVFPLCGAMHILPVYGLHD